MFEHGYALLIGVDQNRTPNLALPTVKKDVTKLKEVLTHPDRCGYLEENVRVVTGMGATRDKILDGLDWLRDKVAADKDQNQTALVYYSGHGHREGSGESFFIPYDVRFPIRTGALPAKDFPEILADINPRRLFVILDCCHAEGMNVKDASAQHVASAAVTKETPGMGRLAEGDGRVILSSSRGTQQSWIRSDGEMSVFTYHLAEALIGHAGRPAEPDVTVTEVMDYVARSVPKTAREQHDAEQQPFFQYSGSSFPIALVIGGKGIAKGMTPPDPLAELPHVKATMNLKELEGEATNVDIDEMNRGNLEANAAGETIREGGKFTNLKINKLGKR